MATIDDTTERTTIDDVDSLMRHLFALVANGLRTATLALLDNDRDAARAVIAADTEFDTLLEEIELRVEAELASAEALPAGVPFLISVLRIAPELERSGDLVEHIALRAGNGLPSWLTPSSCELVREMGALGVSMWLEAATAYTSQDRHAAIALRTRDDELDDLHVQLTEAIGLGTMPPALAIEMGLIARFYERLGDHAVNVVRRLPDLGLSGAGRQVQALVVPT